MRPRSNIAARDPEAFPIQMSMWSQSTSFPFTPLYEVESDVELVRVETVHWSEWTALPDPGLGITTREGVYLGLANSVYFAECS